MVWPIMRLAADTRTSLAQQTPESIVVNAGAAEDASERVWIQPLRTRQSKDSLSVREDQVLSFPGQTEALLAQRPYGSIRGNVGE